LLADLSLPKFRDVSKNRMAQSNLTKSTEIKTLAFKSALKWREWLEKNYTLTQGIWLRIYKKDSGKATVFYPEALDEALCFGWIDGQKKPYDEESWLQKFTPRRAKSNWSKINTEHAERLTKAGKMHTAGLKAIEEAKADGRWEQAYQGQRFMEIPDDFMAELNKNKKAKAFFETLNKVNLYAIGYRLQTAKRAETRQKRIVQFIEMFAKGEKFH